jgi:hypothetical protein
MLSPLVLPRPCQRRFQGWVRGFDARIDMVQDAEHVDEDHLTGLPFELTQCDFLALHLAAVKSLTTLIFVEADEVYTKNERSQHTANA